jgi:hypothetical protein
VFGFLNCPDCKKKISAPHCPLLDKEIKECEKFESQVIDLAMKRAKFEELHKEERLSKPGD